jgi:hypothetical protein
MVHNTLRHRSILYWIERPAVYINVDSLTILLPDTELGTLSNVMYPILHLCAKNDYYGNPQRLYVMSNNDGLFVKCWDEGYNGYHAVPEELRNEAYLAQRLDISEAKYNTLKRKLSA